MAEGLGAPDMRSLRRSFLAAKPRNETNAQLRAVSAAAMAKGGNERAALVEYEAALALDPLNDEFHRHYWALKRRLAREREGLR
jgi:membrane protein required for beta-lactamase induction